MIGWDDNISGLWWGAGVIGLSALVAATILTLGRRPMEADVVALETREERRTG